MPRKKKTEKPAEKPVKLEKQERVEEKTEEKLPEARLMNILMPYLLGLFALFLFLCFVLGEDRLGYLGKISPLLRGLFSYGAYAAPVLLLLHAFFYKKDLAVGSTLYKFWFTLGDLTFLGVISALISDAQPVWNLTKNFTAGVELTGGGLLGGLLYAALKATVGAFTPVLAVLAVILFTFFLLGSTPGEFIGKLFSSLSGKWKRDRRERADRRAEDRARREEEKARREEEKARREEELIRLATKRAEEEFDPHEGEKNGKKLRREERIRAQLEDDVTEPPVEDLVPEDEVEIRLPRQKEAREAEEARREEEARRKREITPIEELPPEPAPSLKEELEELFATPAPVPNPPEQPWDSEEQSAETELSFGKAKPEPEPTPEPEPSPEPLTEEEPLPQEEYLFPPISLLQMPAAPQAASHAEQDATAKKLVETLASFGVKTSICGISKGPAVTRYELQPQPGVRVRSIVNLTDDIALALASGGVRIEAPIPGKEAVGIEVPNRQRETVPLRALIEREEFRTSTAKLNCCLGADVAGKPIFCDLSKMPHILIAGATGMGKSVCLNSLLVSILYHATPDEVKLILIDPKKVEMSIYNRIPHLTVPVVSDSKKAAATLNWAVIEMEKRFIEMEEVGVRDIKDYNTLTKNDPEKPPMPQMVIVIDELADLMMVARDEVETSICRLAQKARAAGIHLVIGTQRPSVDVITGLIKSNIPSRIACTVASQVDSRTIIDIQGAEKLMGKGDMLYAPVGAMKPIRVQGCFVSTSEIESVCDFIRSRREAQYDEAVSNLIEREAGKVGERKKGGSFAEEEEGIGTGLFADKDPLLEKAIEVAVSERKVATSLLQRRLSVGYARAAKLIDYMEEMHVVGPYAGSKPREVLWTPEFFAEYKMRALEEQPIE